MNHIYETKIIEGWSADHAANELLAQGGWTVLSSAVTPVESNESGYTTLVLGRYSKKDTDK